MNRTTSRELWARIAAGEADPGLQLWLKDVAQAILDADELPAGIRPGELVRALGLPGRIDDRAPLRESLELVDSFPFVSGEGGERQPDRGERMRNLIAAARDSGLVEHDVSDPELRKRIERMLTR